ncbi:MAG: urease accessory protein UreF [Hylemonella sp.]
MNFKANTSHQIRPVPAASLLQLIWLASPALPVGGFSYSEGLEAAVDHSLVLDEPQAETWLVDQLYLGLARSDLAVLASAIAGWSCHDIDTIRELNHWILQTRESSELRMQTVQMGRSLLLWLRNHNTCSPDQLQACENLAPTYPIAFALAACGTAAGLRDCMLAYAFAWAENMTQAAMRTIPLGQGAGQRILARLAEEIPDAVELAISLPKDKWQAFSPMLAILSSRHETQYSRLFRS